MKATYNVPSKKFVDWLKKYLVEALAQRRFNGGQLGLAANIPGGYQIQAVSIPAQPYIYLDKLQAFKLPVDRPFIMKVLHGESQMFTDVDPIIRGTLLELHFQSPQKGMIAVELVGKLPKLEEFYQEIDASIEVKFPDSRQGQESGLDNREPRRPQTTQPAPQPTRDRRRATDNRIRARLVHWKSEVTREMSQADACTNMHIDPKTYRNYRDDNLLYTDEELARLGTTLEEQWESMTQIEGEL